MSEQEQQLIARAREGEAGAFREIVEKYKKSVYFLAYDLTGNHHDAEDLSQEVFIKVYGSLEKFRGESKFGTWLSRITVNSFINVRRKKVLRAMHLREDFSYEVSPEDPFTGKDFAENPERSAESGLIRSHIDQALRRLTAKERTVFVLRHYQDLPLKEIASILSIAEGTVKNLLFRAIRKLRKELDFYRQDLGWEKAK